MQKPLLAMFFLLLLSVGYALTPEEALDKYYSASASENWEEYFSVLDTSGMSAEDIAGEQKLAELTWNTVDEQTYSLGALRKVMADEGNTALLDYILTASYKNTSTGEVTRLNNAEHVALLNNYNGDWKVVFALPLQEYLTLRDVGIQSLELQRQLDEGVEAILRVEEQGGKPKVLIDGMPYDGGDGLPDLGAFIDMLIGIVIVFIVILVLFSVLRALLKKKPKPGGKEIPAAEKKVEQKAVEKKEVKPEAEKPAEGKAETSASKKEFSDAMKVLRKRYASGEITKEQFQEMKKELEV